MWLATCLLPTVSAIRAHAQTRGNSASEEQGDGLLTSLALKSRHGPVEITAQRLEFDYRELELAYHGEVVVTQGEMTLRADRLRILLAEDGADRIREVVANGNVRIEHGERVATGGQALFDRDSDTVILSEGAVLREGPNEVTGERVIVYLDEERSVVEGGDRPVRARLFPPDEETAEDSFENKSGD